MHSQSFSICISSSREEGLMERLKDVSRIIDAVQYGISRELIIHMEPMQVPYDREHRLCVLNINPDCFCCFTFG
jgi:hypothetical protein